MRRKQSLIVILLTLIGSILVGCVQSKQSESENFSELALRGKQIFEAKECGKCHYIGDEKVESEAPDLTDPFIANDSLFVQTHLKFVGLTKMPPIELTSREIDLLSFYVAELHRAKHPTVSEADADARCPVCYAPVSIAQAKANKLTGTFLGQKYYFECEDCLQLFRKYPVAFRELFRQYQLENGNLGSSLK